jgi:serine/threonine protein kinase
MFAVESRYFHDSTEPDFTSDSQCCGPSDATWLLSAIKSLCLAANQPGRYDEIAGELLTRHVIPPTTDTDVPVAEPRPGSSFSQVYTNLAIVGEGGYGRVFKIQNLIDKQIYALKVIPIQEDEVPFAVREVQCLARLASPHIVRYYTSWLEQTENEDTPLSLFIQMEFVHGTVLSDYLETRSALDVKFVIEKICELAEALAEIHAAGIVHRDFRPANVLLRGDGTVCIIDFGIASMHDKSEVTEQPRIGSLTVVRSMDRICLNAAQKSSTLKEVGTPMYSSPSQLNGHKSGPKDDVYSFGITIFEMLTLFRTSMEKAKAIKALRSQRTLPDSFRDQFPDIACLVLKMTDPKQKNCPDAESIVSMDTFRHYL